MRGRITALVAAAAAAVGAASAARWARGRKDNDQAEIEVRPSSPPPEPSATTADASAPEPAAPPVPAPGPAPSSAPGSVAGESLDDLTAIKGLGKVKAAKLVAAGVTSYAQVAAWTEDDIAEMGLRCNTSPGQIKREDWVGQARALAGDGA